jgi:hypothetical protein
MAGTILVGVYVAFFFFLFFACSSVFLFFSGVFLGSSSSVLLCFLPVLLSVFSLLGEVAFAQPL